ncbi:MAG: membrane protein [marine bacterium B5-7]|nr:MAG: membrane protein [marine bacterium B5-7]
MTTIGALIDGLAAILPLTPAGSIAFLFLFAGVLLGFLVGILPGISSAGTIALLIPFTYSMEPTATFAFLLGLGSVTATTGDVTSVLVGIPGEGTAAATVIDGHAMTRRGQAGRALGAALGSSVVGALIGALGLALAIPVVRPLLLSVGSPELFMLTLLAITSVSAVSGRNRLAGLAMACFGFWLSMIGFDPVSGVPRFTFDMILGSASLFLWDGLSLVAVSLGLFAIPEIVVLFSRNEVRDRSTVTRMTNILVGFSDVVKHRWLVLRCSLIGAYIGLLPGVGGGTAQWVAYAHAKKGVHGGDESDEGSLESDDDQVKGVLGPGAANNSKEGGSLVPTLAFGIPGSVSTAILLSAFVLHGVVPGPAMLDPERDLGLTFSMLWTIVIANLLAVALCLVVIRQLIFITLLRGTVLAPFLLLFVFVGSFAVSNGIGNVIVTAIFGALGCLMIRNHWPRPPLLLGLVLGSITENSLSLSIQAHGAYWWMRPGVLLIAIVPVMVIWRPAKIFLTAYTRRSNILTTKDAATSSPLSDRSATVPARASAAMLVIVFLALLTVTGIRLLSGTTGGNVFPFLATLAGTGFALGAAILLFKGRSPANIMQHQKAGDETVSDKTPSSVPSAGSALFVLLFATLLMVIIETAGFALGAFVVLLGSLVMGARVRIHTAVVMALTGSAAMVIIFQLLLALPLPNGLVDIF